MKSLKHLLRIPFLVLAALFGGIAHPEVQELVAKLETGS